MVKIAEAKEEKKEPKQDKQQRPKRPKKEKKNKKKEKVGKKKPRLDDSAAVDLGDDESNDEEEPSTSQENTKPDVYLPSMPLGDDEELVCDPKAYLLHHQVHTGYPCLCFDLIPDSECKNNKKSNFDAYIVAGTQAERRPANRVLVMKLENLHTKSPPDESSAESSSDSDSDLISSDSDDEKEAEKPRLYASAIRHPGAVNRVKFSASNTRALPLVATWSDEGKVNIFDVSAALVALNSRDSNFVGDKKPRKGSNLPQDVETDDPQLFTFQGHETEGFALDWSPTVGGQLISGDCNGKIHLWLPREAASWTIDAKRPFTDHEASVEDLQWSPTEKTVFCSCSVDASLRVWDVRAASRKSQLSNIKAHSSDVNVIAWNRVETSLLLSGGDDGALKVWDFRNFKQPVAHFQHHTGPVTSVQWCPHDSSVFAASGEDDQLTLWDCGVEPDDDNNNNEEETKTDIPPQLLFIHQGQKEIKELRWYPHSEGVVLSVASTGLDIFRTISV